MDKTLTPFLTDIEENVCPVCVRRKPGKMTDCEIYKSIFEQYKFEYINTFFNKEG